MSTGELKTGVPYIIAKAMSHHKVIVVKEEGYLSLLLASSAAGTDPVALKFDSFDNAMAFISDFSFGVEEMWPDKYREIDP